MFKTEAEAIEWVQSNTPFAVKPKGKSKYQFISPFVSYHAQEQVVNHLGKELFKLQEVNEIK